MIRIGETVVVNDTGMNMAQPSRYLTSMCLGHLSPRLEYLYKNERCIVIGRSEFHQCNMVALKRIEDNAVFVAYESNCKIIPIIEKPAINEALEALKICIETEINLMFEDEFGGDGYRDVPESFDYEDWYEIAREVVYNLSYIMTLRNFIEGE